MGRARARKAKRGNTKSLKQTDDGPVGFLGLPREIRDRIYEFVLVKETPIRAQIPQSVKRTYLHRNLRPSPRRTGYPKWHRSVHGLSLNLLRCNRQIASEAAALLYRRNVFHLCCWNDWTTLYLFLQCIGLNNRHHLRNIEINMTEPRAWPIGRSHRSPLWWGDRREGLELSFLDAGRPGLPPATLVHTLPSSIDASIDLLYGNGSSVRLNIVCNAWSPVPGFYGMLYFGPCYPSHPSTAETIGACQQKHEAVKQVGDRVEIVWTLSGEAAAADANKKQIEWDGWEILGPERGKVNCSEKFDTPWRKCFTIKKRLG